MRELSDRSLVCTIRGTGPTVLFLHGIGSSRRSFEHQLNGLSLQFRCVACDAPGYNESPDPGNVGDNRTYDGDGDLMDWFAAQYEELVTSSEPIGVVGISFGAVVAARMAMRQQVQIGALVLADTSRGSGTTEAKAQAMRARPDELDRVGARAFSAARAARLVSPQGSTELIRQIEDLMATSIRLPGYEVAAAAMASTNHTDRFGEIDCPTLVVVGEHDAVCPPAEAQRIADSIVGATLKQIPDAGHLANLEQPEDFNRVVLSHLRTHLLTTRPSPNRNEMER